MAASAGLIAFTSIMLCVWGTRNVIPQLSTAVPSSEKLSIRRIVGELKLAFLSPSYRSIFLGLLLGMVVVSVETVLSAFMGIHFWGLETD